MINVTQLNYDEFVKITGFNTDDVPARGPADIIVKAEFTCHAAMRKMQANTRNEHLQAVLAAVPTTAIMIGSKSTDTKIRAKAYKPDGTVFDVLIDKPIITIPGKTDTLLRIPYHLIDNRAKALRDQFPSASEALIKQMIDAME